MKDDNLKCYELLDRHRNQQQKRSDSNLIKATILALLVMIGITIAVLASPAPQTEMVETWDEPVEIEEPENELIEAALFETGYFRRDIPLDGDTQAELRAACEEFNIDYELALAVIHQESTFRNVTGDSGRSVGYMQIQARWWSGLMAEIGVTDLSVPYQNFRTGCAILRQLLDLYGTETRALTAYNTGRPGTSSYARSVLAYKAGLES